MTSKAADAKPPIDQDVALEGYESPTPGGWDDYPLDELAIRDEQRTAQDVIRRIDEARFVIDPDFQRDFVWDEKKQSRLIESVLMRIPLPVFYVSENQEGKFIVVDGRQRLTTLQRFLTDQLSLVLEDRQDLHGKQFSDLEPRLQNRVQDCQLRFYIIGHLVPERARLDIFERVNGGEVLTRQQMRNAIYNGPATRFLKDEAQTDLFKQATGRSLNAKKMQDREFINRFCAFLLLDIRDYPGDMDPWLAESLRRMNGMGSSELESMRAQFRRAIRNNVALFGKHAFRKHWEYDVKQTMGRNPMNASLFDVMSTHLACCSEAQIKQCAPTLRERFYALMQDESFGRSITFSTSSTQQVKMRFERIRSFTAGVPHAD